MSTVASLIATLGLDASGFNKGIDDAERSAGGLSKSLNGLSTGALVAGTAAVAGLGAGLYSAVSVASSFEQQMDAVGAVAGATGPQMQQLSAKALQLGEDTAFGAREAGAAMEELAANGVPVQAILDGAADATVALAAAGGTDLVTAASVASTALGVWGMEATELTDVVNRVAGAANTSKFGVEDMAGAMAQGGGAASAAGVDFADFSTTIAATAKYFSSGSDAGTSFKTFLSRLGAPTKEAAAEMQRLGIEAFNADGSMKDMGQIAGILQASLGSLTEEQRSQALATIFGSDASRTAIGLMETGAEAFQNMSNTMRDTDAAAVAAQRMDNFKGAMDQVMGSIETLQIKIGTALLPILTQFAQFAASAIPAAASAIAAGFTSMMTATEPFRAALVEVVGAIAAELMPKLTEFADWFTGNQDAMMAAGVAVGTVLAGAFLALAVAAGSAAAGVIAATLPFVAIVAVLAAVGAGIYLLIKHWDDITAKFPIAATALEAVKSAFESVLNWITGTFIPGFSDLASAIGDAIGAAVGFVQNHWSQIEGIFSSALTLIGTQVRAAFTLIGSIIEGAMQIIAGIIRTVTGVLTGDWQMAWDGIKGIVQGVWTIVTALVQYGIDTIKNVITNGGAMLKAAWSLIWDALKTQVSQIWDGIKAGVSAGVNALPGVLSAAGGLLVSAMQAAWEGVKTAASAAWDGIKSLVSNAIQAIPGILSAAAGLLASAASAAWEGIKSGAQAVWSGIISWVQGLPGEVAGFISGGAGLLMSAGTTILNALWEGAKSIWETALAWAGTLPGLAADLIKGGAGLLLAAGEELLTKLWDGAKSIWSSVLSWAGGLAAELVSGIGDLGSLLYNKGVDAVTGFLNGLKSAPGAIAGAGKDMAGSLLGGVSGGLISFSPSKATEELGIFAVEGLIIGASAKTPEVREAGAEMGQKLLDGLAKQLEDGASASQVAASDAGQTIIDAFAQGIIKAQDFAKGTFARFAGGIVTMFEDMATSGETNLDHLSDTLTEFGVDTASVLANIEELGSMFEVLAGQIESGAMTIEEASGAAVASIDEIIAKSAAMRNAVGSTFEALRYGADTMNGAYGVMHASLLDAGYSLDHLRNSMQYVMPLVDEWFAAAANGAMSFDEAMAGAMNDVTALLDASAISAEEWALKFQETPKQAAEAFNLIPDSLRFALGAAIEELGGFGRAAGEMFEDYSFATERIGGMTDDLANGLTEAFDRMTRGGELLGNNFNDVYTMIADAARDAGYDVNSSMSSMGAVMERLSELMVMVGNGTITMEDAISLALSDVDGILAQSQLSVEDWAAKFAEDPRAAAQAFNELNDTTRYALGEMLQEMGVFSKLGGALFEDFSFDIKQIPLTFEQTGTEAQKILGGWGAMFAKEIRVGGHLTKTEVDTLFGDIEGLIQSSTMTDDAKEQATAMLTSMTGSLERNKGTVTHQVQSLLSDLLGMLTDPNLVATAESSGEAIGAAFKQFLIDMGLDGLPEELQAALTAALTNATAGALPAAQTGGAQVGAAINNGIGTGFQSSASEVGTQAWWATGAVITRLKQDGTIAANDAGKSIGTGLTNSIAVHVASDGPPAITTAGTGAIHESEISLQEPAAEAGTNIGEALTDGIAGSVESGWGETAEWLSDSVSTMSADLQRYFNDTLVALELGATDFWSKMGTIMDPSKIFDPLTGEYRERVTSDAFTWRGNTGNSPTGRLEDVLKGLPEDINGLISAGNRGGGQGVKISGDAGTMVANGWLWTGSKIREMTDAEKMAHGSVSGWNSTFDPTMVYRQMEKSFIRGIEDGEFTLDELNRALGSDTVKLAALYEGKMAKEFDDLMGLQKALAEGNEKDFEKYLEASRTGVEMADKLRDIFAAMHKTVEELPDEPVASVLADGVADMKDVLAYQQANLTEAADAIMRYLAGNATLADALLFRREDQNDFADAILGGIAEVEAPADLGEEIETHVDPDPPTQVHVHLSGYIDGMDEFIRKLNEAAEQAGLGPVVVG